MIRVNNLCVLLLGCAIHGVATALCPNASAAFYNVGGLNGLTFFAPQLNMASNPLWGRNMECDHTSLTHTHTHTRTHTQHLAAAQ